MWTFGGLIATCGLLVWLELGLSVPLRLVEVMPGRYERKSVPRSGGEKNYVSSPELSLRKELLTQVARIHLQQPDYRTAQVPGYMHVRHCLHYSRKPLWKCCLVRNIHHGCRWEAGRNTIADHWNCCCILDNSDPAPRLFSQGWNNYEQFLRCYESADSHRNDYFGICKGSRSPTGRSRTSHRQLCAKQVIPYDSSRRRKLY